MPSILAIAVAPRQCAVIGSNKRSRSVSFLLVCAISRSSYGRMVYILDELPKGLAETARANWQQGCRRPAFTHVFFHHNFTGRRAAHSRWASHHRDLFGGQKQ